MKKDVKFSTRMASTDREAIKELAKQSGMSMSDYVTACCLGKQVVVIDGLKEVLKELKSIGRNLNQLVTLAHMGRVTVIDLESVCRAFSELCGAVRMILERMLIYGKEATTQIENSVPYYSVSKWSSNTKMLLLHFHAP